MLQIVCFNIYDGHISNDHLTLKIKNYETNFL